MLLKIIIIKGMWEGDERETKRDRVRHSKAPVTIEWQKLKGP